MAKVIELAVGERAVIYGMNVECMEDTHSLNLFPCSQCAFYRLHCKMIACVADERKDGKGVYFKLMES